MRELLPFALLACACGAAVREPAPSAPPAPAAITASPESSADASDDRAAFESLGALGPSVAPGMREAARKEGAGEPVELVKADTRDVCARVAFQATAPVAVKLVDEAGRVLAELAEPRDHGTLGEGGPVCVRKGEVVRGIAPAGSARVRWMAWAAP